MSKFSHQVLGITKACYKTSKMDPPSVSYAVPVETQDMTVTVYPVSQSSCIVSERGIYLTCLFFDLFPSLYVTSEVHQNLPVGFCFCERIEMALSFLTFHMWVYGIGKKNVLFGVKLFGCKWYVHAYRLKVHGAYTSWRAWITNKSRFFFTKFDRQQCWRAEHSVRLYAMAEKWVISKAWQSDRISFESFVGEKNDIFCFPM